MLGHMPNKRKKLSDQIRQAIDDCGLSRYAICKATGLDQASMSKFMRGERGLGLDTIDQLADLLNLNICTDTTKKGK